MTSPIISETTSVVNGITANVHREEKPTFVNSDEMTITINITTPYASATVRHYFSPYKDGWVDQITVASFMDEEPAHIAHLIAVATEAQRQYAALTAAQPQPPAPLTDDQHKALDLLNDKRVIWAWANGQTTISGFAGQPHVEYSAAQALIERGYAEWYGDANGGKVRITDSGRAFQPAEPPRNAAAARPKLTKLAPTHLATLRRLAAGITMRRHWTGHTYPRNPGMNKFLELGWATERRATGNMSDWYVATITDEGRAALAALDGAQ